LPKFSGLRKFPLISQIYVFLLRKFFYFSQQPYFASADNADHFLLSETDPRYLRTPIKNKPIIETLFIFQPDKSALSAGTYAVQLKQHMLTKSG
jgi:hypothetical protein